MKSFESLKDVEIIKDFFSKEELDIITKELEDAEDNDTSAHSGKENVSWSPIGFTKDLDAGEEDMIRYPINPVIDKDLYEVLKRKVEKIYGSNRKFQSYFHYMKPGCYMNWHTETGSMLSAISIYLTENWDENYGGYICYGKSDDRRLVIPSYNTAVLMKAGIKHAVTPIYKGCPSRKSLQIFIKK